jgi:hypothetical protein
MQPTHIHRVIGLLLMLNCRFIAQANERPGPFVLSGGCITSATQYVVNGNIPAAITATVASGGSCAAFSYQWQRSTDNVYFTNIPGATGQNLGFTASLPSTQATWFQRKTTCGAEVAYTGSVSVNMIVTFYFNVADTGVYTRTCATGGAPQPYTYIVRASKYASPFNQQDADDKAQKDLTDSGLYYANLNGVCLWYNVEKRNTLSRSDCGSGFGSSYLYIVWAKKYSSAISQPDADAKAQKDINDSTQFYANRNGICTWYNGLRDSTTTKKDCPAGTTPASYKYIVAAGKYASTNSQADADAKAGKDIKDSTQLKANANGLCQNLFISMLSGATDPGPFSVTVKNLSGTVLFSMSRDLHETIDYAAAVPAASGYIVEIASMSPMYAEVNGQQKLVNATTTWMAGSIITIYVSRTERYYNDDQSITFFKACDPGYIGSPVPYGVPANKYGSYFNKQEATQQAQNEINTNGQTKANNNGTCSLIQNVTITLKNSFLRDEFYGCTVKFFRAGSLVKNVTFPGTETGTVPVTLPAGSYTMTFTVPNSGQPFRMSFKLQPPGTVWMQPSGQYTITTGTVTFDYGTAYTLTVTN